MTEERLALDGEFLRPYQKAAIASFREGITQGHKRQIVYLPTGVGKTILALGLARAMGRTLWLAHRKELIDQPLRTVATLWPEAKCGVVKRERNEFMAKDIVFASVQTITQERRLKVPWGDFALVVVDEVHHVSDGNTYDLVLDHFGEGQVVCGLTATPTRADGENLGKCGFSAFAYRMTIDEAIKNGFLCPFTWKRVVLARFDLSKVRKVNGDYDKDDLEKALKEAHFAEEIARVLCEEAKNRKTIVFTPTVATAKLGADEALKRGVRAAWVSGGTKDEDREGIIRGFASGAIEAVFNCGVFTEGFDEPSADCAIIARPTMSKGLYIQMAGRVLRLHPGKQEAYLFDVVDALHSSGGSLATAPRLVAPETKKERTEATQGLPVLDQFSHEPPPEEEEPSAPSSVLIDRALAAATEGEAGLVIRSGRRNWIDCSHGLGLFALPVSTEESLVIHKAGAGWQVDRFVQGGDPVPIQKTLPDLALAQGIAEDYARQKGVLVLSDKAASWRSREPSRGQYGLMKQLGCFYVDGITQGEAADLITAAHVRRKYKPAIRAAILAEQG